MSARSVCSGIRPSLYDSERAIYGKPELVPTSVNAPAKKQGGAPRPAGRGPRRGGEGKRK